VKHEKQSEKNKLNLLQEQGKDEWLNQSCANVSPILLNPSKIGTPSLCQGTAQFWVFVTRIARQPYEVLG